MIERKHKQRNAYSTTRRIATLTIRRRNGDEYQFQFDKADLDKVRRHLWHVSIGNGGTIYALSGYHRKGKPCVFLHRLINDTPEHEECSFVNGNPFDVRKSNLRNSDHFTVTSLAKGKLNPKSGFKGITYWKAANRWRILHSDGTSGGSFPTVREAVEAQQKYEQALTPPAESEAVSGPANAN